MLWRDYTDYFVSCCALAYYAVLKYDEQKTFECFLLFVRTIIDRLIPMAEVKFLSDEKIVGAIKRGNEDVINDVITKYSKVCGGKVPDVAGGTQCSSGSRQNNGREHFEVFETSSKRSYGARSI